MQDRVDSGSDRRWEQGQLLLAVVLILAQGGLIAALLVQRRRALRAQAVARSSESKLRSSHARVRELAGRLIEAQEAERTRIARDLHDDACQEIAGVAIDVCHLRRRPQLAQSSDGQELLRSIERRLGQLAESLRLLSHQLRPTVLQHIGLVAALEAHCAEVDRLSGLQVSFVSDGEVEPVNLAVALSLFRIAQEALRNASRHGHAERATVSLVGHEGALTLSVADDGVGFEPDAARGNGGLGLASIEERALLLNGRCSIRSKLGHGTRIEVRAPIEVRSAIERAGAARALDLARS